MLIVIKHNIFGTALMYLKMLFRVHALTLLFQYPKPLVSLLYKT